MNKSWMFRTSILAVASGLVLCAGTVALAQDQPASAEELKQVQNELSEVKAELKAVRKDLKQVLNQLKTIKSGKGGERKRRPVDTTVYNIDIGDAPFRGPKDAPVTIVEYVDFQCPFCIREAPSITKVLAEYPDKVRWVFKHFPLQMHPKAKPAHAAAALAQKQKGNDGFWQYHDLILANPKKLTPADLRAHAEALGMDLAEFDEVMGDPAKINALLSADMSAARGYKVTGTPTVFINGLKLASRNFNGYKARIDEILKGKGKDKGTLKVGGNPNPNPTD